MPSDNETGIILAAYGAGTNHGHSVLARFEERVRREFPSLPLRWVFTGHCSRPGRLSHTAASAPGNEGAHIPLLPFSAGQAFQELADAGVTRIAMQPLQIIPGAEFEAVLREAATGQAGRRIRRTTLGLPLLSGGNAVPALAARMALYRPEAERHDAHLWVGHGSLHAGQGYYDELTHALEHRDAAVLLGTLRPEASFGRTVARLRAKGYAALCLAPFFSLPGRHAARDILGDAAHSWKSRLEREGFSVRILNKGLLEQDMFIDTWMERLHCALAALGHPGRADSAKRAELAGRTSHMPETRISRCHAQKRN